MDNKIMMPVMVGVIAAGVGFVGGMQYQKINGMRNFVNNARGTMQEFRNNQNSRDGRGNGTGMMQNQGNGGMMRGNGMISGEVTAKDDKSITIKMNDGSSRIVNLSDSTKYSMSADATLDKIQVGTTVATFGNTNSDGSTTATSIEINPMFRGQAN